MRKWLLQNGKPDADRLLIGQLLHREEICRFSEITYADNPSGYGKEYIPVGDIPFTRDWLWQNYKKKMIPIEVPEILRKPEYLHRDYYITDREHLPYQSSRKWFVKNADRLKEFNSCLYEGRVPGINTIPPGNYVVSGWLKLLSEFRVFVHDDAVLAVQHYVGQPLMFPDAGQILNMAADYRKDAGRPEAYTMDVAVSEDKDKALHTVILEVHPFVSCGLYGFRSADIPDMLEKGIRYYTGEPAGNSR